jgi:putative ABC transport system substrate-binding protein
MKRREFIALLGGTAAVPLVRPRSARAQQDRMRRVGVFNAVYEQSDREWQARYAAFINTLQSLGWSDGGNVRIEYRQETGDIERLRIAAAEVARSAPDVIVSFSNPIVIELRKLTATIPIVFVQVSEALDGGLVPSLARPAGNMTGFQNFEPEMGGKWLGVLNEAAPSLKRAAVLFGSDATGNVGFLRNAEAVAPSLGVTISPIDVFPSGEIERALARFAEAADGGLIIFPHPLNVRNRGAVIVLAARYRLPAIYPYRYFAAEGGLLSYGPDQIEQWRGAASYVDRILRGEKPGNLPVQAPTNYELVVNLKTAKALGLVIPPAFPLRADEVIE